uniref:Uncharacterized protein n=1 Tax=Anguilla anguilla TaxID=7936 RepID=A0A0E9TJQ4_ANGAN
MFVNLSYEKHRLRHPLFSCGPGCPGWMYIRLGISGSAFPATIQRELWNLYRQSSAATISINKIYLAFLSRPFTRTLKGGNIRLKNKQERELTI